MDIKRLKYFCTVIEFGNITKAAEYLHISQPPLSKRLQELEDELGTTLLLRQGGKIEATPAGYFLYEQSLDILKRFDQLKSKTLYFANQQQKNLKIGLSHLYQNYFTDFILELQRQYSHLQITVTVSDSGHLETLLNNRLIDLALIQKPKREGHYNILNTNHIPLVALVHRNLLKDNKLTQIDLSDIGHYPLIMLRKGNGVGVFENLLDKLHKNGVIPKILMQISQPNAIVNWIESGIQALALLPRSEIDENKLSNSKIIKIVAAPDVFSPSIVKLSSTALLDEIIEILQTYSFITD